MRQMTHVVTILKLPEILRKMLRADMHMRAVDATLQLRPTALNAIGRCAELAEVMALFLLTVMCR